MVMWAARGYHVHRGLQRQQILCALGCGRFSRRKLCGRRPKIILCALRSGRARIVADEGGGLVSAASVSPSPWPRSMAVDGLNCRTILINVAHTPWCSFRSTTWQVTPECKLRNGVSNEAGGHF
eukprot:571389-Pyramimonas_sp.AAC.1